MRDICYHVAVTLDGCVAHDGGSVAGFPTEGDHIEDYEKSLHDHDAVIMGLPLSASPGANTFDFSLIETKTYDSGVVLLDYVRKPASRC